MASDGSAKRARIGILIGPKGRGSNMRAIAEACRQSDFPAEVAVVVSPQSSNPAVEWAQAEGLDVRIVSPDHADYAASLLSALSGCELVCLAGYLRLLPPEVLEAFPGRILNIHPALLPKFGGKGMYGLRVHEAVLAGGDAESGCSVHLVTDRYDEGEIVVQRRVPVHSDDSPDSLASRVLEQEHLAYPEAIRKVLEGR